MSPSSSSNAEPAAGPTFKVVSCALSADLTTADVTESARELGAISAAELAGLLARLSSLDPVHFADADPHLIVSGRRGRFTIKPGRGRLLLRSAGEQAAAYFELPADQVPSYIDGYDRAAEPVAGNTPALAAAGAEGAAVRRTSLALGLFALAAILVAGSAVFTFRGQDVDPASDYDAVMTADEIAAVHRRVSGRFVAGEGRDERVLEVRTDGTLSYREAADETGAVDERNGPYRVVRRRADQATVLRVEGFGPVEARADGTLHYAGEAYHRPNIAAGAPAR